MIPAHRVKQMMTLTHYTLPQWLKDSGYTGVYFNQVEFVGINREGQFVYDVQFPDESGTGNTQGRVFVSYDWDTGKIKADF